MRIFQFTNITAGTTTDITSGHQAVLRYITVNTTAAGTITVYNGTTSDSKVATLKASVAEGTYRFDCVCSKGITVVTAAASDITVIYELIS